MSVMFRKAERRKAKARVAIAGPAGAGKTYSALLIAKGLGGKVAFIDTENGSGDLYADLLSYDILTLSPPYMPEKYTEGIRAAEEAGYDIIIIDSLSHAWAGEGGLLDVQGKLSDTTGNSWTAWRKVTPRHNALVEAILQSKCHIIATMRSKMDYAQAEENGKKVVKKLGLAPIQRDGMEYEFTVFFDINHDHLMTATKDRTRLFDGQIFTPDETTGGKLLAWLEMGVEAPEPEERPALHPVAQEQPAHKCADCGCEITQGVETVSTRNFGRPLCLKCQRAANPAEKGA